MSVHILEKCYEMPPVIKPKDWKNIPDPLTWITEKYTNAIEQIIRQDPEQYWWVHRRWKTRPPEEKKTVKPMP